MQLTRKSPLLVFCPPLNNYYWIQPLSLLRLPQLKHKHQPSSKLARKSPLLGLLCLPLNNDYRSQPLSQIRLMLANWQQKTIGVAQMKTTQRLPRTRKYSRATPRQPGN